MNKLAKHDTCMWKLIMCQLSLIICTERHQPNIHNSIKCQKRNYEICSKMTNHEICSKMTNLSSCLVLLIRMYNVHYGLVIFHIQEALNKGILGLGYLYLNWKHVHCIDNLQGYLYQRIFKMQKPCKQSCLAKDICQWQKSHKIKKSHQSFLLRIYHITMVKNRRRWLG